MNTLAFWRDLSIVFLSLIAIVMLLVPGVILFFAQKYLRLARRKLKMPLLTAQLWALRVEHATLNAAGDVVRVPITVDENVARYQTTVRAWFERR